MKKFLPYAPLAVLIIGTFSLQISMMQQDSGLLSNAVSTVSGEVSTTICTKPEGFTESDESAWCQKGLASNIKEENNVWNWSCIVGEVVRECTFEKTINYPTRGGVLFKK